MSSITFTQTMTPFFSLSASTQRERIASLKKAFQFIAGENLQKFIEHFLVSTNFGKENFLPVAKNNSSNILLENIRDLLENSPSKHRPALQSLVTSQFSLDKLLGLGFNMTQNEYYYSRKIQKQRKATLNNYTRAVPPSKEKIKDETLKK